MTKSPATKRPRAEPRALPREGREGGSRPAWTGEWRAEWWLALAALVGLAWLIYEPALHGEFMSDDQHYVYANPYVTELSFDHLLEMWNPKSVLLVVVENYAPVHLMLHSLEYQVFGTEVYGYHVVNVALHALAAALLMLFYRRTGIGRAACALGAALFLAHSANVEAVAWISQLKGPAALVLALAALLLQRERPWLATLVFALALFAKPSALFALPVLVMWEWSSGPEESAARPRRWLWLAAWAAVFGLFALIELTAFSRTGGYVPPLYADPVVRLRSGIAIAMRYLAMAATTYGLSTFQEPEPVLTWLDPWVLGGLAAGGLIAWRVVVALRRRSPESLYWAWALSSYSAVSGLLPLPFPMADRYLYAILPGLVGALLFVLRDAAAVLERLARARGLDTPAWSRGATVAALAVGVALLVPLSLRSHERARVWQTGNRVMADAELHYPNGTAAATRKATRAAQLGDADTAVRYLREAHERGYNRLDHLYGPEYALVRDTPVFQQLLHEIARGEIARLESNPEPSQLELHVMALAYQVLGDTDSAIRSVERALAIEGPISEQLRADLVQLRAQRKREQRRDASSG